ncbi:hypothetical protein IAQ61_007051, partial [Plenodomus lingam]|uniref:uncharacterized protein n=1 Tax=Leptosphaeria maculans TaxID=5022 RepID=UPI0033172A85
MSGRRDPKHRKVQPSLLPITNIAPSPPKLLSRSCQPSSTNGGFVRTLHQKATPKPRLLLANRRSIPIPHRWPPVDRRTCVPSLRPGRDVPPVPTLCSVKARSLGSRNTIRRVDDDDDDDDDNNNNNNNNNNNPTTTTTTTTTTTRHWQQPTHQRLGLRLTASVCISRLRETSARPHPRLRRNSKAPAPGRWKFCVAQLNTIFSHQPGLSLRQPSAGHRTLCWVRPAPAAWLQSAQHLVVLGIAVRSGQRYNPGARYRSCCPRTTASLDACIAPPERQACSCSISNYNDTVPRVSERRRVFPATSNQQPAFIGNAQGPKGRARGRGRGGGKAAAALCMWAAGKHLGSDSSLCGVERVMVRNCRGDGRPGASDMWTTKLGERQTDPCSFLRRLEPRKICMDASLDSGGDSGDALMACPAYGL